MTLLELIITFVLGAIVIGPVVGVAYFVMKRREPVIESAEASKQLRIFRSVLADDWASASEVVINPQTSPGFPVGYEEQIANCDGYGWGGGPIRVAMVTSYPVVGYTGSPLVSRSTKLRILYREVPRPDGTITLRRQVCRHRTNEYNNDWSPTAVPGGVVEKDWKATWRTGGRTDEYWFQTDAPGSPTVAIGSDEVMLDHVRAMVLPAAGAAPAGHGCNTTANYNTTPPVPCDMNVTVVGIDENNINTTFTPGSPHASTAQRSTLRLHQQVGPLS